MCDDGMCGPRMHHPPASLPACYRQPWSDRWVRRGEKSLLHRATRSTQLMFGAGVMYLATLSGPNGMDKKKKRTTRQVGSACCFLPLAAF